MKVFIIISALTSPDANGQGIQVVPGLTATGGFTAPHVGTIPISYSRDFQHARGSVQCWTRLRGNNQVLDILAQPGILPIHHHWTRMEIVRVTTIPAQNLGEEERKRDPNWLASFIQLLRNEMRRHRGVFSVSAVSRPIPDLDPGTYKVTVFTRNGRKLAGSDGRPIWFTYSNEPRM